mmetsp:Transcript_32331/g.52551  ORF Transcript_32331/g.52551 Transcript_32331/m.52551 type:complete len:216 (+) Transcript_32331:1084-1731(+)
MMYLGSGALVVIISCSAELAAAAAPFPLSLPFAASKGCLTSSAFPAAAFTFRGDFAPPASSSPSIGHRLCLCLSLRQEKVSKSAIPVAVGNSKHAFTPGTPEILMRCSTIAVVRRIRRDDPAAFGCMAPTSPDRPIPCANPMWRALTRALNTRPSRSPTPTLSGKLFESIEAISLRKRPMVRSSHGSRGIFLLAKSDFMSFSLERLEAAPCLTYA